MWDLALRGGDVRTEGLFSYVSCEGRVPGDHPLRRILPMVDEALSDLSPDFAELYAPIGRPSIAPEKLLRALLLQAFYSIRSERQLMERLDYDLLFRWFVGLGDGRRRCGMRLDVLEEPRPSAGGRHRGQVPGGGAGPAAGQGAAVGRALLGRRHADRGLGLA